MGRGRPLLVVVLAVLSGGAALSASSDAWRDVVRSTVQGMTLDEVIQWSNGEFRRQATVGRYVRWGGSIVLASVLIAAGLDYYYNYLRRETGTSLDTWYKWPTLPPIEWVGNEYSQRLSPASQQAWEQYYDRIGLRYTCRWFPGAEWYPNGSGYAPGVIPAARAFLYRSDGYTMLGMYMQASIEWAKAKAVEMLEEALVACGVAVQERPPLSDWLQSSPDAANGVKQAVQTYIDSTPIGSSSQPWPGVQLDPVPNPNQWTDNPFTRPDIDTDGDGYTDAVEWNEANRRGLPWPDVITNPDVHPDPQADPDGDGFTTGEEIVVGTDPYDATSSPRVRPAPSTDTDGDTWPDAEEVGRGTDPRSPQSRPYNLPYNQDSDGDGAPDWKEIEAGTDPYSPDSQPQPDPNEQPKDEPQWPGGPPVPGLKPVEFPERQAERERLPNFEDLLRPWEEQVAQRWRESVEQLKQTASRKFPFGIVIALSGVSVQRGSAQCSFTVPIGPAQATIAPCDTPIFQTAETFRPVLAGLVWVGFVLVMVRRGLDIPG